MKKVNVYQRKDGKVMLYVNDYSARVSLGIGEQANAFFQKGQRKLEQVFWFALRQTEATIQNFSEAKAHDEKFNQLENGLLKLYITDKAEVAGNKVGADGAYLAFENNLYSLEALNEKLNALI